MQSVVNFMWILVTFKNGYGEAVWFHLYLYIIIYVYYLYILWACIKCVA